MAISSRGNALLSRLSAPLVVRRCTHTVAESGAEAKFYADVGAGSVLENAGIDIGKWRKVDSRAVGITRSVISPASWSVLRILRRAGYDAYLVGGCVRDLLLNKVPKDFDVITTAALKQIRKKFHHSRIVGKRFPICMVHVQGSDIEVSSFETVAEHSKDKEKALLTQIPCGFDKKDIVLWKNCMLRDFTVNSLFLEPFIGRIYDYTNGIMDVMSMKLRTLIPAQLSFQEDSARILRGLRIAARLGFSISKDTEVAIDKLSSSITTISQVRLVMELNYMLSYGAAEPSLRLLQRFNLLEILLPFHAAYLAQQAREQSSQNPVMLMNLFFNLDKLVTSDKPAESTLWVALLAFHMALVNNPQDALVVWTFASVLYHLSWKQGVEFARKQDPTQTNFVPEISGAHEFVSDEELAEKVAQLAAEAQDSVKALTEKESLLQSMSRFPNSACSGLVILSNRKGQHASIVFDAVKVVNLESSERGRESFNINYDCLKRGNCNEVRFVLGKIIMDTMSNVIVRPGKGHLHITHPEHMAETLGQNCYKMDHDLVKNRNQSLSLSNVDLQQKRAKKQELLKDSDPSENLRIKKQNTVYKLETKKLAKEKHELIENNEYPKADEVVKQQRVDKLPPLKITVKKHPMITESARRVRKGGLRWQHQDVSITLLDSVKKSSPPAKRSEKCSPQDKIKPREGVLETITGNKEKPKQDMPEDKKKRVVLSSFFRQ